VTFVRNLKSLNNRNISTPLGSAMLSLQTILQYLSSACEILFVWARGTCGVEANCHCPTLLQHNRSGPILYNSEVYGNSISFSQALRDAGMSDNQDSLRAPASSNKLSPHFSTSSHKKIVLPSCTVLTIPNFWF